MDIEVIARKIYGQERFYPESNDAKIICTLLKRASFTKDQLKFCKENGWTVKVKVEEYKFD